MMVKLRIDGKELEVPAGISVLEAARFAGVEIPALCLNGELGHFTSCMLCMVKDHQGGRLFPSCSVTAASGMDIITEDAEIREARRTALELLLSDHVGDCEAPCRIACPAHMDIPRMNRLIAGGKWEEALRVVKRDIAMPAVLGRICPAPCEGACHRKTIDEAVSVCLLKRIVGDLSDLHPFPAASPAGRKVAVIGAGPAGLAAAYYLRLRGAEVMLYDREEKPGGQLRSALSPEILPGEVLDREIRSILDTGIVFHGKTPVGDRLFDRLKKQCDAIVVASGIPDDLSKSFQLAMSATGITVTRGGYETSEKGVFAVGGVVRSSRLAVRSMGQGKEVAFAVLQYLQGEKVTGEPTLFNSRFGKLQLSEYAEYLKESIPGKRGLPVSVTAGFTKQEAMAEASRCMHCDCRGARDCKLRIYAGQYQADQRTFQTGRRKTVVKNFNGTTVVYEPEKCIKCGICVRITAKQDGLPGLTYIGRGFDITIGVPFGESTDRALAETAQRVAEACPTGALKLKHQAE